MNRKILALPLALLIWASPSQANTADHPDPLFPGGLPASQGEDACVTGVKRCVWDADHRGNRQGHSLILTRWHGDYVIKRVTDERAGRLTDAWCSRPSVGCEGYAD